MNSVQRREDYRNALLCGVAVLVAIAITWPLADLSFDDDWSYAFTVKRLLETGHIHYNGWSSPLMITQTYWGWIWVRLFGFSFNVLRLSMMPLAVACVGVSYFLSRRCGLHTRAAMFVSLLLGLSPLFLPLAASFMNDVPGCVGFLVSVYALVRCGQTSSRQQAMKWMAIAATAGVVGGLSRQTVWVPPLVILPYLAWIHRRDRVLVTASVCCWIVILTIAKSFQNWFDAQPLALPEPSSWTEFGDAARDPLPFISQFVAILLTWILLLLPAAITVLWRVRSKVLLMLTVVALLGIGRLLWIWPRLEVAPWMNNLLTPVGVLGGAQIPGGRPVVLRHPIWMAVSVGVFVTAAGMIALGGAWLVASAPKQLRRNLSNPDAEQVGVMTLSLATVGYLLVLLTRCALKVSYDRHLLPVIPCAAILLLRRMPGRRVPAASWLLLALFGIYGIASTQEDLALARARVIAAARLTDAHIPRVQIQGGLEYDFWTQLLTTGYINNPLMRNPAGAFRPHAGLTPDVKPVYRLEYQPADDAAPSRFGTVSYFSLLPPFRREISIDRINP